LSLFSLMKKVTNENQEIPQAIRAQTHHTPAGISGSHLVILAFFYSYLYFFRNKLCDI